MTVTRFALPAIVIGFLAAGVVVWAVGPGEKPDRDRVKKAFDAGNFKDAYEGFRALALDPKDDPRRVGDDLNFAVDSLRHLGRVDEVDDFREAVLKAHPGEIRLAQAVAESLVSVENYGF